MKCCNLILFYVFAVWLQDHFGADEYLMFVFRPSALARRPM